MITTAPRPGARVQRARLHRLVDARLVRVELRLFLRQPGAVFGIVGFPVLLLVVLGLVPPLREPGSGGEGLRVIDLYVPVSVLLAAVMGGLQAVAPSIATYRERKVLKRYATTPASPGQLLFAQYAVHAAAVSAGALLVLLIGSLVFDVRLPGSPLAYLLVFVLVLAVTLVTGGLVGGTTGGVKSSAAVGTVVFVLSLFTAGVYFPVAAMPGALGQVVQSTPLGAAATAMDAAAAGGWPNLRHVLTLLGWTVGLSALAARFFRWQ